MSQIPRILPLLAIAVGGVLTLRMIGSLEGMPDLVKTAQAIAAPDPKPEAKPDAKADAKSGAKSDARPSAKAETTQISEESEAVSATDASEEAVAKPGAKTEGRAPMCAADPAELARNAGLSPAELRVIQSLGKRRDELEARERQLDTQAKLVDVAQSKLDARIKQLEDLKGQLQGLLGSVDSKQDQEVLRMVKVYESMKPQQAAAIIATLDDKVRIPVASKMKEKSLAAILAKMPPAEAKKLTERLAARFDEAKSLTRQVNAATAANTAAPATPAGAKPAPAAKPKAP